MAMTSTTSKARYSAIGPIVSSRTAVPTIANIASPAANDGTRPPPRLATAQ